MHDELALYLEETEMILIEVDRYKTFKKQLLYDLKSLNREYEAEAVDFKTYSRLKEKLLDGKTKEEQTEYFNSYILSLVKKLEYLNTQTFSLIYNYSPEKSIIIPSKAVSSREKAAVKQIKTLLKPKEGAKEVKEIHAENIQPEKQEQTEFGKNINLQKTKATELGDEIEEISQNIPLNQENSKKYKTTIPVDVEIKDEELNDLETIPKIKTSEKMQVKTANSSSSPKEIDGDSVQNIDYEYGITPKPLPKKHHVIPKPRKKGFKSMAKQMLIGEAEKEDLLSSKGEKGVGFKSILNLGFLKDFVDRIRDNEELISKDTLKEKSLLDFKSSDIDFESEAKTNPNLLVKQASQLKELLKIRKIDIYKPSMVGTIANIFVRRFSIFIIDNFPDFFKKFYLTLRYANIKVLSNTYVNIMVFMSILSAILFGTVTAIIAIASGNPIFLIISKTFLLATLGVIICAGAMIYYPNMRIEKRIKSINTNLPFAIDHMSSISASGVPPSTMFRLLSESKEYGDVSLEIEKASNFIDIFGYDLLTAIKSVSATTPSPQFREFFEGLVSTIETGGSLKNYLAQKSQESMLAYKIERQKYTETIATYSDIYTGVLIAAPLFFVSALSLVSILGGKIGGFAVETVISFGTYVLIPLLNIAFIVFLEFNQPEV
jgi:flagellar protein FlaJ